MMFVLNLVNQAVRPGLRFFNKTFQTPLYRGLAVLCLCAALLAIFHDNMRGAYAFDGTRLSLADMDKGDMLHYARSMQSGIAQTPHLLTNLKSEDVTLILAKPEMDRFDGPTTVWQYRTQECVLDVYYTAQDRNTMDAQVTHYEIRARQKDRSVDATACLEDLYQSRASQIAQAFEMIFASYVYVRDPLEG